MTDSNEDLPYDDNIPYRHYEAARRFSHFLRALPPEFQPYQILKTFAEHLGEDMATEVLRLLMNPSYRTGKIWIRGGNTNGKKIQGIKLIRELAGLGLREAKDVAEETIALTLPDGVDPASPTATRIFMELRSLGFTIEF